MNTEIEELTAQRDKLADLLRRTAIALRGPEPPLTRWSWHDLPERAEAANLGQRQPLDFDAAHAVFELWYDTDESGVEFVRRIEAAHGIGGPGGNASG